MLNHYVAVSGAEPLAVSADIPLIDSGCHHMVNVNWSIIYWTHCG